MSIKAMTWAFGLPLEPRAKIALLAIADNARDDDGAAFPSLNTIAKKSSQSESTVRRRIKAMADAGVLTRQERYRQDGSQTSDLLILNLAMRPEDVPETLREKKRGSAEDDQSSEADTDADDASPPEGGCQADTPPLQSRHPGVAVGEGGGSQSGHPVEPSLEPKDSTPNPLPGGRADDADAEEKQKLLAVMKRDYPTPSLWNWSKCEALFIGAPLSDCRRAAAASHAYAAALDKPRQPRPMRPDRWFRERMFENYPDAKIPEAPRAAPEPVWYPDDSDEFRAIAVACAVAGEPPPSPISRAEFTGLWIKRTREVGPDLLALARWHHAIETDAFPVDHAVGTGPCEAWRSRLAEWLGREVKPRRVWLEPFDPAVHGVSALDVKFKMRRCFTGLRVPWIWPPRRDGTLSPEDEALELASIDAGEFETEDEMEQEHERDAEDR